jgi:Asp-tRNA(Asn)/Glu-tRNA(Gln) amidotransferase A subunit family amidase
MQGPDAGDPSAAPVEVRWPEFNHVASDLQIRGGRDSLGRAELEFRHHTHKPRIGYFEDDGRTPVTGETRAAVKAAAEKLRGAGFEVEAFRPEGLEKARELWWKFFGVAGGMLLGPLTQGHEHQLSPILKQFQSWVAAEMPHTAHTLLDCWMGRDQIRMQIFQQMERFPVLLCPVAAVPAFWHGERSWEIDGQSVAYLDAWSYCEWFNLLGMPGVALPLTQSAEGLPIGVQIVTRPWEEELALSVAEAVEQARGEWTAPNLGD